MGKNLDVDLSQIARKIECQDPEHEGDRIINNGDIWMEWPDFLYRCDACHRKKEKSNLDNVAKKSNDTLSQEELELLDRDSD